jgi:hypothetical protein
MRRCWAGIGSRLGESSRMLGITEIRCGPGVYSAGGCIIALRTCSDRRVTMGCSCTTTTCIRDGLSECTERTGWL